MYEVMDKEYIEEITITNAAANYPGIEVSVVRDYMTGKLKPKTNADRIRAMSDEELAEFIGRDTMHDICPNDCYDDLDRQCNVCVLDWLKQEVEE